MNYQAYFAFLLLLFSLVGCQSKMSSGAPDDLYPGSKSRSQPRPEWTLQKPFAPDYYMGVAVVPVSTSDYQRRAKLMALEDLSSEISVEIASTSVLQTLDVNRVFQQRYESIIRTEVREQITGHELVGDWTARGEYWVFYRLSKVEYARQRAIKRNNAVRIATEYFTTAENFFNQGQITAALTAHVACLDALHEYLNEPIEANVNGTNVLIAQRAYQRIQDVYAKISFIPNTITRPIMGVPVPVVGVLYDKLYPISSLPVILQIERDRRVLVVGDSGAIKLDRRDIRSVSSIRVSSLPEQFTPKTVVVHELLKSIQFPAQTISIQNPDIVVLVTGTELINGEPMREPLQLLAAFGQNLTNAGIKVTYRPDARHDFKLEYTAAAAPMNIVYGIYHSTVDIQAALFDAKGIKLFNRQLLAQRGNGANYLRSSLDAYRRSIPLLPEAITTPIIQFIF